MYKILLALCVYLSIAGIIHVNAETIFEDDFNNGSLAKWEHVWPKGAWAAKDGELKNSKGNGAVSVKADLPEKCIVSFYINKGNKLKPDHYCGIKLFKKTNGYVMLMLRPAGARYFSSSAKKEIAFKKSPKLKNNQWYRVTIWLNNDKTEIAVDGSKIGAIHGKIDLKTLQVFCRNQTVRIKDFCVVTDNEE